jgi:hypothetical protein
MIKVLFFILLILPKFALSYEVAAYEVKKSFSDKVEIRSYNKILLAQVFLEKKSRNSAFRSLFKYISGANNQQQKIAMTSPVLVTKSNNVARVFSFIMPSKFVMQDIPQPLNKEIRFKFLQNSKFVAIRFSGRSTDKNFNKYQKILTKIISESNLKVNLQEPIYAYYNAPWTLFFLKRNEILFKLQ